MAQVEVVVICAEDLKNVGNGILAWGGGGKKMSSYVVCWVDPGAKQRTKMVSKAGREPQWNETVWLPVDAQAVANPYACLHLQIMSTSSRGKDALVGSSWIALHQVAVLSSSSSSIALPVHRPSGRIQGLIRLRLRMFNPLKPETEPENSIVMGYAATEQLSVYRPSAPPVPSPSPPPSPPPAPLPPPGAGAVNGSTANGVLLGLLGGALAALLLGDFFLS